MKSNKDLTPKEFAVALQIKMAMARLTDDDPNIERVKENLRVALRAIHSD